MLHGCSGAAAPLHARLRARFALLFVDEFQDTNGVQYEVLKLLAADSVFVVGDADQAIYGWRGADYGNQRRYDRDFSARLLKLERNYRSAQPVLVSDHPSAHGGMSSLCESESGCWDVVSLV